MTAIPLLEITSLGFARGNRVFAKCENHNPISHSHYDRVYDYLFDKCLQRGQITRGKTVLIETSSGNAGTAFAKFCELYGFEGIVVFPKEVRASRVQATAARNVTIEVSPYDGYMKGALRRMLEIVKAAKRDGRDIFIMNHSQTWDSVVALQRCGFEIVSEFRQRQLNLHIFVSALGNGTSTTGIGLRLKQFHPRIRIVGFEPSRCPVFTNKIRQCGAFSYRASGITGTGVWGIPFPNMHTELLSDVLLVNEDDSDVRRWSQIRDQVREAFGESIGLTSCVSIDVARRLSETAEGENILILFYDVGEFYGNDG